MGVVDTGEPLRVIYLVVPGRRVVPDYKDMARRVRRDGRHRSTARRIGEPLVHALQATPPFVLFL